jgi:hypothetical protein
VAVRSLTEAHPSEPRAVAVRLDELARELGPTYRAAKPFPHIVLDGVFDDDILDRVLAEWPARDAVPWITHDDGLERGKRTNGDIGRFGPTAQRVLTELSRPFFLEFLTELTGIPALIPDPYFAAAGLFETTEGGYLDIHADFSINARTGLDRRCNVLIYLNRDWTEANGGQLEFWGKRPFDVRSASCRSSTAWWSSTRSRRRSTGIPTPWSRRPPGAARPSPRTTSRAVGRSVSSSTARRASALRAARRCHAARRCARSARQ